MKSVKYLCRKASIDFQVSLKADLDHDCYRRLLLEEFRMQGRIPINNQWS